MDIPISGSNPEVCRDDSGVIIASDMQAWAEQERKLAAMELQRLADDGCPLSAPD